MTPQFQIGDVVALKSGSLRMTIEGFLDVADEHGQQVRHCNCVWFEGDRLYRNVFPVAAVAAVRPAKAGAL